MTQHSASKTAARALQDRTGLPYQRCLQAVDGVRAALEFLDAQELLALLVPSAGQLRDQRTPEYLTLPTDPHSLHQLYKAAEEDALLCAESAEDSVITGSRNGWEWTIPLASPGELGSKFLVTHRSDGAAQDFRGTWRGETALHWAALASHPFEANGSEQVNSIDVIAYPVTAHVNAPPTQHSATPVPWEFAFEFEAKEVTDINDWLWHCYDLNDDPFATECAYGGDQLTLPAVLVDRYERLCMELNPDHEVQSVCVRKGMDNENCRSWYGIDLPSSTLTLWLAIDLFPEQ